MDLETFLYSEDGDEMHWKLGIDIYTRLILYMK